jgi:hypothetical protein
VNRPAGIDVSFSKSTEFVIAKTNNKLSLFASLEHENEVYTRQQNGEVMVIFCRPYCIPAFENDSVRADWRHEGSINRADMGSHLSASKRTASSDAGHPRLKIFGRDRSDHIDWYALRAPQRHR